MAQGFRAMGCIHIANSVQIVTVVSWQRQEMLERRNLICQFLFNVLKTLICHFRPSLVVSKETAKRV